MKKYKSLILPTVFPYVFGVGMGAVFLLAGLFNDILRPFFAFAILFLVLIITSIISTIFSVKNLRKSNESALKLAKINMIIKLVQIPAYIIIFIVGGIYTIALFHAGILAIIVFSFIDCISIAMSGIIGVVAVWEGRNKEIIDIMTAVFLGICQFIFCIDVIASVVLYRKVKKSQEQSVSDTPWQ